MRANDPYVFLVGCPRSGTTLLQRMLDNHPSLAIGHEFRFVTRTIEQAMITTDCELTPALIDHVVNHRSFRKLHLNDRTVREIVKRSSTLRQFIGVLFSEFAKRKGKSLAGEKTPHYVLWLPQLNAVFPNTKIVHLIRDGRNVALSTLEWEQHGPRKYYLWQSEPIAACALWWLRHVDAGRRAGRKLGPSLYSEVLYENLVERTKESLWRLGDFLELPYAPEMETYYVGKVRREKGSSAKKAWLPPTSGLRDWRRDLKDRDIELFEALAGDLLTNLSYERVTKEPSPRIAKLATRCREAWSDEMGRRK